MARAAVIENSCSDCSGLVNGTRTNSEPHEYLVPAGAIEPDTTFFTCLLCKSELTRYTEGFLVRWS